MAHTTHLEEKDLKEIFTRSSGPGGQNVNKVASRVTLRHLPTGVTVSVQTSRSQHDNRRLARERLLAAIQEKENNAKLAARDALEKRRRRARPRPRKLKEGILESKRRRSRLKQGRGRQEAE